MTRYTAGEPKPHLLYLSPVIPATTGNGLAMRAGTVLRLLAEQYAVSLLVVPLYPPVGTPIPGEIGHLCRDTAVLPAGLTNQPPAHSPRHPRLTLFGRLPHRRSSHPADGAAGPSEAFQDVPFEVVHLFRLAMLPYARRYLERTGPAPRRHLDLDDVESIARGRLATLYRLNGHDAMARVEEALARRSAAKEAEVLRDFDRLYVCSEGDREALCRGSHAPVCVLPNALPVPPPLPPKRGTGPFTFLFVGTLGYYPNEDAILHFCTEVLPLIRRSAPRAVEVAIVGAGTAPAVQRLAGLPDVRLIGGVPDVAAWYAQADAVVVPIRAGGGTRIKVLEAFSYRRPVVSTSLGIEGIAARAEEHVLLGDTSSAFAQQCLRLMSGPQLGERITRNAYTLFLQSYTIEAVARSLAPPSSRG